MPIERVDGVYKLTPYRCNIEGCECQHCKQCGRHYEPCAETARHGGKCDACIIGQYSAEAEAITDGFNGNYEEAARYWGW